MIPLIRVRGCLLVVLQGEPSDEQLTELQERIAHEVAADCPKAVILDVRSLEVVDSFMGNVLSTTVQICSVLGSEARVVGVRADLAITWVELGLTIDDIRTRRTLDEALDEFTVDG